MNELALFSGAGGGILGGKLLGWKTLCAVEIEPFRCERLAQRQNEGFLPPFPIWCGDIAAFDGRPWRGIVDVVSGGFPCQDISAANPNAIGITGERSGLWRQMLRILRETGPAYVFVENSPLLRSRGLGRVLSDLSALGYDARWGVLGADDIGGFHQRERLFIVAYAACDGWRKRRSEQQGEQGRLSSAGGGLSVADSHIIKRRRQRQLGISGGGRARDKSSGGNQEVANGAKARRARRELQENETRRSVGRLQECCGRDHALADADSERELQQKGFEQEQRRWIGDGSEDVLWRDREIIVCRDGKLRATKPGLCGMAHGVADRLDRISAAGDGQVPAVVATAWQILAGDVAGRMR